eukprot:gene30583-biopygen16426
MLKHGLKQASKQWYIKVKTDLMALGLNEVHADQGLFVLPRSTTNNAILWLVLWVDDFFILYFSRPLINKYKTAIGALYKTIYLVEPSVCLLKSANLAAHTGDSCYPCPIPKDSNNPLPYTSKDAPVNDFPLAAMVGSLNYLALFTRTDIAKGVNRLARHSPKPLPEHMDAATGIPRYLAGIPNHGILYSSYLAPTMTGFCDSDHASCQLTRKSTTSWVFLNQGGVIIWQPKLQQYITALSSTESEYVAASQAAQEALWLIKLMHCAGAAPCRITIQGDNQASLNAWNQDKMSTSLRHVSFTWRPGFTSLRKRLRKEDFSSSGSQSTASNAADMFTLPRSKFQEFRAAIGCLAKNH